MWACKKCRESVEDTFEVCWNCGTSKEGVEDPSFQPEVDVPVVAEAAGAQPAHRPSEGPPSNLPSPLRAEDHVIARGLIWVFRALALIAGSWGLLNVVQAVEASRASREVVLLFAAVITAVAVVAFPLGMAEVIRLCLLVEANTRVARQTPARDQEKRGRR